jgi:hypothetical protein
MASASYKPIKPIKPTYLTLDYTIVPNQPIYLVDVDRTLLMGFDLIPETVEFLKDKANVFLFTKMTATSVSGAHAVSGGLALRYNLIETLKASGVNILAVITPGDGLRYKKLMDKSNLFKPGQHYAKYLYKLERNEEPYILSDYNGYKHEPAPGNENNIFKNDMYDMAKNYFVLNGFYNNIIFIDDEIEQIFSVGLQKLVHDSLGVAYTEPQNLILINVNFIGGPPNYFTKQALSGALPGQTFQDYLIDIVKNKKSFKMDAGLLKSLVETFRGELNDQAIEAFQYVCKELNINISDIDLKIKSPYATSAQMVDTRRPPYAQQFNRQGASALANRPPPAQPASESKPKPPPKPRLAGTKEPKNSDASKPIPDENQVVCSNCSLLNPKGQKTCDVCEFPLPSSNKKTIGASASANTPYGQPSEKWTQTDIQQLLDLMQKSKITNIPINELIGSSGTRSPVILKYQNSLDNQTSQDPSIWSKKQLEGLFELQQMSEALNEPVPIQDLRGTNGIPPLIQKYIKLLQVSLPDTPTDELPCKACTFLNLKNRNFCQVCGTKLKGGGGKKRKTKTKTKSKSNKASNKTKKHTKSRVSRKYHNKKH